MTEPQGGRRGRGSWEEGARLAIGPGMTVVTAAVNRASIMHSLLLESSCVDVEIASDIGVESLLASAVLRVPPLTCTLTSVMIEDDQFLFGGSTNGDPFPPALMR